MGGTMRLGQYSINLEKGTKIHELYQSELIHERHRHRYEVNSEYFERLNKAGLKLTGFYSGLAETLEIDNHPYFIGTQYHPEFKSSPWKPSPPYLGLIEAAIQRSEKRKGDNDV